MKRNPGASDGCALRSGTAASISIALLWIPSKVSSTAYPIDVYDEGNRSDKHAPKLIESEHLLAVPLVCGQPLPTGRACIDTAEVGVEQRGTIA